MKNPSTRFCLLVPFLAATLMSCTLITNFDDPGDGGDDERYSLEANVEDPVGVVLKNDRDAIITLSLLDTLPKRDDDGSVLEQILSSAITLTLENQSSGATVDLTQGTLVQDVPDQPGEYRITTTTDRDQITVEFFNQIQDGRSLGENGNYEAVVEIMENDYLETETFTRDVTVTKQQ